ncbi:hypothetical protein SAMN02745176_03385 [Lutispora thermophila DSM 19022]|uniref:Uncharacterized protein n=1 Tax=Lutispora thermophila DSM 19022 TaxID=1122184 RepID=A0A1M6IT88_9FIRM|nr:hypothetical protein SAMN02745176_03385 [Lutispora thermophila DSM 19022]
MTSGVNFHFAAVLGAFMIVANLICETLLSIINAIDIMDAIYETVGIILVFICFYCVNSNGLIEINSDYE